MSSPKAPKHCNGLQFHEESKVDIGGLFSKFQVTCPATEFLGDSASCWGPNPDRCFNSKCINVGFSKYG